MKVRLGLVDGFRGLVVQYVQYYWDQHWGHNVLCFFQGFQIYKNFKHKTV